MKPAIYEAFGTPGKHIDRPLLAVYRHDLVKWVGCGEPLDPSSSYSLVIPHSGHKSAIFRLMSIEHEDAEASQLRMREKFGVAGHNRISCIYCRHSRFISDWVMAAHDQYINCYCNR